MTQAGAFTYTWEHGRQLANMTSSTADIDFTYDSNGMRVGKTVTSGSTVTDYDYIYNGGQLTGEVITTNGSAETLYYSYDASGTPVSVKYNNTLYFYVTNLQGDVIAIMNSSGTIVVEYTYDAWGYIRNTTGSLKDTLGKANALRYRSYVYDTETCLYYLQSRYYNPGTGRFINADALVSTGQGILGNNMFVYCNNNAVVSVDTSGAAAKSCISADGRIDDNPWRDYSPRGGGRLSGTYSSGNNYGSVADKCYAIRLLKILAIDEVDGVKAVWRMGKGIRNIGKGIALILVPVPTTADDLLGVYRITSGIINTCWGLAEWIGELFGK